MALTANCEEQLIILRRQLDAVVSERDSANLKLQEFVNENRQKELLIEQFNSTKDELQERLRRRGDECDRLREELKFQAAELVTLQGRANDSHVQLSEVTIKSAPLELELAKVQRQRDFLEQQLNLLQNDYFRKSEEERQLRSDSTTRLFQLESRTRELELSVDDKDRHLEMLKDALKLQQDRADDFLKKYQETETALLNLQASTMSEIDERKRLTDMYKSHFEEAAEKINDLEETLFSLRNVHSDKLAQAKEYHEQTIESLNAEFDRERQELQSRIDELEAVVRENPLLLLESNASAIANEAISQQTAPLSKWTDLSHNSPSQLFEQIVSLEKTLVEERSRRKEVETQLNDMLKELERQAPVLNKQRRDYTRIVQSHDELSANLDKALIENARLSALAKECSQRAEQNEHECKLLEHQNNDLARQLQHLLSRQSQPQQQVALIEDVSRDQDGQDVISSHLVVFDNVAQLQSKNEELLRIIRELTTKSEEHQAAAEQVKAEYEQMAKRAQETDEVLSAALSELSDLRVQRQKSDELLVVLQQQRDMSLRNSDTGDRLITASAGNAFTPQKDNNLRIMDIGMMSPSQTLTMQARIAELQIQLEHSQREAAMIQSRCDRLESAEQLYRERETELRAQNDALRVDYRVAAMQLQSEKEKAARLESSQKLFSSEREISQSKRGELERTAMDLQRALQEKDAVCDDLREAQRRLRDEISQLEAKNSVLTQNETRLTSLLREAQSEAKRAETLSHSLARIESGLQARADEQSQELLRERDSLKKSLDNVSRLSEDRKLVDEQKIKSLEEELRILRVKFEARDRESHSLSESLHKEQAANTLSTERATLLEKQLNIAQERLTALQGSSLTESLFEKDLKEKEKQVAALELELTTSRESLALAEKHVVQFQSLSKTNEEMLAQLRERDQARELETQRELEGLRDELARVMREYGEKKASTQSLVTDLESARDEVRALQQQLEIQAQESTSSLALLRSQCEVLLKDKDGLVVQVEQWQERATTHFEQYEQELQLHAKAERNVREARDNLTLVTRQLSEKEREFSDSVRERDSLRENLVRLQRERDEEKVHTAEQVESVTRENALLHSQVQSLAVQLEKSHEQRLAQVSVGAGLETTDAEATVAMTTAAGTEANFDEIQELRKSLAELREVLRFMKKEKEMLSARLTLSESECNRLLSQVQTLSHSLDEARAELKRESDASRALTSNSTQEFERIRTDLQQLHILRESNTHLRSECEELRARTSTLQKELTTTKDSLLPLQIERDTLKAEKDGLLASKTNTENDVKYWRDRLQSLLSRYSDVDPEEHRIVKEKLANCELSLQKERDEHKVALEEKLKELSAAQDALKALEASSTASEKKLSDTLSQKEKELTSLQQSSESLRQRLRQFKETIQAKTEEVKGKEKEVTDLQVKVDELTKQLETKEKELVTLKERKTVAATKATTRAAQLAAEKEAAAKASIAAVPATEAEQPQIVVTTPSTATPPAETVVAAAPAEAINVAAVALSTIVDVVPAASVVPVLTTPGVAQETTTSVFHPPLPAGAPPSTATTATPAVSAASKMSAKANVFTPPPPSTPAPGTAAPAPAANDKAAQMKQQLMMKRALQGKNKRQLAETTVSEEGTAPSVPSTNTIEPVEAAEPVAKKVRQAPKATPVAVSVEPTAVETVAVESDSIKMESESELISPASQQVEIAVVAPSQQVESVPTIEDSTEEGEIAEVAQVTEQKPKLSPFGTGFLTATPAAPASNPVMKAFNPFANSAALTSVTSPSTGSGAILGPILGGSSSSSTTTTSLFGKSPFGGFGASTATDASKPSSGTFGFGTSLLGKAATPFGAAAPSTSSIFGNVSTMDHTTRAALRQQRFAQGAGAAAATKSSEMPTVAEEGEEPMPEELKDDEMAE